MAIPRPPLAVPEDTDSSPPPPAGCAGGCTAAGGGPRILVLLTAIGRSLSKEMLQQKQPWKKNWRAPIVLSSSEDMLSQKNCVFVCRLDHSTRVFFQSCFSLTKKALANE